MLYLYRIILSDRNAAAKVPDLATPHCYMLSLSRVNQPEVGKET
ncbi:MAG: hypothetical protein V7K50_14010 [Nostoc sp.]